MGLRERKKEHTREVLTEAALRLFREHGYDDTTVEMIAEEAMVSSRTFFRYFEAKDAVLAEPGFAIMDLLVDRLRAEQLSDPSVAQALRLLAELLDEQLEQGSMDPLVHSPRQSPEMLERSVAWRQRWAAHFGQGLAELDGRSEPTLRQSVVAAATVILMGVAIDRWTYVADGDETLPELAQQVIGLLCADG